MTKAFRTALAQKIAAASSVTSLLDSADAIYHAVAPPQASYPLVIFNEQASTPSYVFQARNWDSSVWLVKAVTVDANSDRADDIAFALDALLTGGTLSVVGGTLFDMRRTSNINYTEIADGEQVRHSGGLYRVIYK